MGKTMIHDITDVRVKSVPELFFYSLAQRSCGV